ncbi:MAG: hypothetical protein GEV05_24390 [Betaproteobacteria bacterium]|nr:hypothetical protein [Betaproteobacteria bacterium]
MSLDAEISVQDPQGRTGTFLCPACKRETAHKLFAIVDSYEMVPDVEIQFWNHYLTTQCSGCGTVSFQHESMNSEEMDFNEAGRAIRFKTKRTYPEPLNASADHYVSEERLRQLRELPKVKFDTSRLVRMLEELNSGYVRGSYLSCICLIRSVINHVPPVFGLETFAEVANNYAGGGRSFREAAGNLDKISRKIADGYLHTPIRRQETVPTKEQVEFRAPLDVLLAEVIRVFEPK